MCVCVIVCVCVYVSEHQSNNDKQTEAPSTFIKVRKYAVFQDKNSKLYMTKIDRRKIRDAVN